MEGVFLHGKMEFECVPQTRAQKICECSATGPQMFFLQSDIFRGRGHKPTQSRKPEMNPFEVFVRWR